MNDFTTQDTDNAPKLVSELPGKVMCCDIGQVRVGVAISDPHRILATPLLTLRRDSDKQCVRDLVLLIKEHQPTVLLIGNPIDLRGKKGIAAQNIEKFTRYVEKIVEKYYPIPVELVDERMTTKIASRQLLDNGISSKDSRKIIDQAAAMSILQYWLDMQKKTE